MLLYSTAMFLSREAFRKAVIGRTLASPTAWIQASNLVWCCVPLGIGITALLCYLWIHTLHAPKNEPTYARSVLWFGVASLLELCTEPLYIYSQCFGYIRLKVVAEGIGQVIKSAVIVILLLFSTK
jgi:hypothetical protein